MPAGRAMMRNSWLDIDVVDDNDDYYYIVKRMDSYVVINNKNNREFGMHNNIDSAEMQKKVLNEQRRDIK